ncbi:hypothetical protein [Streptomyces sp. NPDC057494]|uniref:hypothetical protein n=1 Tax=Streptomyces sp. NPDC057494 TaxID=3346148 RepID=UPI003696431E
MTRTENEADQIVFRWDSENLTGNTGFGPVAWSGPRDEAENLFQTSGPVLRASGDETRPALIRLHKRAGVILIRRLPFKEADGGTSVLCHALVGSPALLDPAVCLGLHAWNWEGADAADLAEVRGRLPVVPEEVLVPATGRGQGELDETLPYVAEELTGTVAELLRHPDDRFTVLDERGDTACPVLWGLHSMFGALIDRRWTFATHDTVELPALRFAFVGRWSGAASRNTERRRVDPRDRCGDRAEDIAARLVRHHLRGVAEAEGGEYAVGSALHAAASARRGTLLETAARAVDTLSASPRPSTPPRHEPPAPRTTRPTRDARPPQDSRQPHVSRPPRDAPDPGYREPREIPDRRTPDLGHRPPRDTPDPGHRDPRYGDSPGTRHQDDYLDPWYEDSPGTRHPDGPDPWYEDTSGDRGRAPQDPGRRQDDPDPWYDEAPASGKPGTPGYGRQGDPDPRYGDGQGARKPGVPGSGRHDAPDPGYEATEPWYETPDPGSVAPDPRYGGTPDPRYGDPDSRYRDTRGSRAQGGPDPQGDPARQGEDPRGEAVPGPRRQDGPLPTSSRGARSDPSGAAYPSSPGPWPGASAPDPAPGASGRAGGPGTTERPRPTAEDRWGPERSSTSHGPTSDPAAGPAPEPDPAPVPPTPEAPPPPPQPPVAGAYPRPVLPLVGPQWTGPAKGSRRVRARRERDAETSLVHKLPTVRSVEEARELVTRGGSRELLDALRRPQAYAVVTVLLREIARRLPSWEHPLRRELCEVAIGRELWAVAPPAARDDPSEPAEEQRAANAAELHRWAVRPLLGGGDAPVGTVAELLSRLRTNPDPSAREAFWLIVEGKRPGLPDAVWLTLLKEAYGLPRTAHRPGVPGPVPSHPDDPGNGYTRRFLRRAALLIGGLVALIVLITVAQRIT